MSITGLPSGVSAVFSANPATPTAQIALTPTVTTAAFGTYPINVNAVGGGLARTAQATLYVVPEVYKHYTPVMYKDG